MIDEHDNATHPTAPADDQAHEASPSADDALSAEVAAEVAGAAEPDVTTSPPLEGWIVTVELALITSEFCKICVAVRLAA